jgi:glutamine amidotransferase
MDAPAYAYFAHSFRAPSRLPAMVCDTSYERETFPSAVGVENVWGLQFHPELSGAFGRHVLANFLAYAREVAE